MSESQMGLQMESQVGLQVEIVVLEPLRCASVHGFGPSPEEVAWAKLRAWAGPRGLLDDLGRHRLFGFNNPSPSVGSPNYGYEFRIELGDACPGWAGDDDARLVNFPGGEFAVTRCVGVEAIPDTWRSLLTWFEAGAHRMADGQCLEQHLGPVAAPLEALEMALYQPIAQPIAQ